ncbi:MULTISPECIES: SDR family NAD(P)-dependent oxidoreductase [unclassified Pseudofrankia]|uniref:SDR family NAD(P)-dependent oxidoreductase n=1 Tax=unclassified Pseudofrankia TaxID=2994372 RepID=UPI0008DADDC5|nr:MULTISPECIES: SDR family oxidoreductase [unclassified Pseudofrankia]MDT3439943.1 SDR family oxidoreductase [Pseudofrankia sp. BMG5.37]OHV48406.1 short-chain dehydrogenase [Pseudofrankia sp. BMG5.36]
MSLNLDLTGKVAIVTGGSRGIGRAIVLGLARAGADVVVTSRKLDNCKAVADEVATETGRRALPVQVNVSDWDDCGRLYDTVYANFDQCHVLINNAGLALLYGDDPAQVTESMYDKTHNVNSRGPFRLSALFGSRMSQNTGGSIINISTAGSWRPDGNDLPYAMAKAGLNAMALGLAGVWAPKVRVNTVLPGAVDTDMSSVWSPELRARAAEMNPMKRIGNPEDYIGVCVFLASDASSYINGAQILADGGLFRTL